MTFKSNIFGSLGFITYIRNDGMHRIELVDLQGQGNEFCIHEAWFDNSIDEWICIQLLHKYLGGLRQKLFFLSGGEIEFGKTWLYNTWKSW